jgi:hypothetical protein
MKRLIAILFACSLLSFSSDQVSLLDQHLKTAQAFIADLDSPQLKIKSDTIEGIKTTRFDWDSTKKAWAEFGIARATEIPPFIRGKLLVQVWIPDNPKATALNPRITDADNETTQLIKPITDLKPGWNALEYLIDTTKKMPGSWGDGRNNRLYDQPIRVSGFSISYKDRENPGTIAIGNIEFQILERQTTIELETGNPIHILKPGDENQAKIIWTSPDKTPKRQKLKAIVKDTQNNIVAECAVDTILQPDQPFTWIIPKPEAFGLFHITASATGNGATYEREMRFGYMEPQGPTPGKSTGFGFGIQSHAPWHSVEIQRKEAFALALCGAKIARRNVEWRKIQPTKDVFDTSLYDSQVKLFEDLGVEIQLNFGGNPPEWARSGKAPYKPEVAKRSTYGLHPIPQDWGDFVHRFMLKNGHRIRFVESWNEPDLLGFANFSLDDYVELMQVFYKAVKSASPDTIVLTGGFAGLQMPEAHSSHPDYFRETIKRAKGHFDSIAFHAHGNLQSYINQIEGMLETIKANDLQGKVTWYSNETAWPSTHGREHEQAEILWKKILYCWSRGGIAYNWYDLRNDGYDTTYGEHNFGLITKDFYPKQSYLAYNTLAKIFKNGTYVREFTLPEPFQAFLFRHRDGKDLIVPSWSISGKERQVFPLAGIENKAMMIDIFGNETELETTNGIAFVNVGSAQAIRLIDQKQSPQFLTSMFQVPASILAETRPTTFTITIQNPTEHPLDNQIAWNPVPNLQLNPAKTSVIQLQPKQTKDIEFSIAAQKLLPQDTTLSGTITVGSKVKQTITIPIRQKIVLNNNLDKPDFILDENSPRRSTIVNAPHLAHLAWKDTDDLSGTVAIAHKDDKLLIRVKVKDDIHKQPYSGTEIWKADSIQFAFQIPNQTLPWEMGCALHQDNSVKTHIWRAPKGFDSKDVEFQVEATRKASTTQFDIAIPFDAIGLKLEHLKDGIPFNLLLNDNDQDARETMLTIAPGLGRGTIETEKYPMIVIE